MTKSRRETMKDIRVIAAIEALKAAVLAVNGDAEVVSSWFYFDIKTAEGHGFAAQRTDFCPCLQIFPAGTRSFLAPPAASALRARKNWGAEVSALFLSPAMRSASRPHVSPWKAQARRKPSPLSQM
jgi:hypothetical protein